MSRISTEGSFTTKFRKKLQRRSKVLAAAVAGLGLFSVRAHAAAGPDGSWANPVSGNYHDASNWVGNTIAIGDGDAANRGSYATFNLGLTTDVSVMLRDTDTQWTPLGGMIFGDTNTGNGVQNWTVNEAGNRFIDFGNRADNLQFPQVGDDPLSLARPFPFIKVNNGTVFFNAGVDANLNGQGLIKAGPGRLVLTKTNNAFNQRRNVGGDVAYQAGLYIQQGILEISDVRAIAGQNGAAIGIDRGATFRFTGGNSNNIQGNTDLAFATANEILIAGANTIGAPTNLLPRIEITNPSTSYILNASLRGGQGASPVAGEGGRNAFVKAGPGTLTLNNRQNAVLGNLIIEEGTVSIVEMASLGGDWQNNPNAPSPFNADVLSWLFMGTGAGRGTLRIHGSPGGLIPNNQEFYAPILLGAQGGGIHIDSPGVTLFYDRRLRGGPLDQNDAGGNSSRPVNPDGVLDTVAYTDIVAFRKSGPGTLVFGNNTNNGNVNIGSDFSGNLEITGGILQIPGEKSLGQSINELILNHNAAEGTILATLRIAGNGTTDFNNNRRVRIGAGGGVIDLESAGRTLILDGGPTQTPQPDGSPPVRQQLVGTGELIKAGQGTLILGRYNDSQPDQNSDGYAPIAGDPSNPGFTGKLTVNAGRVQLDHPHAAGAKIPNPVLPADFNQIHVNGSGVISSNSPINVPNPIFINGTVGRVGNIPGGGIASIGPERTFSGPVTVTAPSTLTTASSVTLSGVFNNSLGAVRIEGPVENASAALNLTNLGNVINSNITVADGGGLGIVIDGATTSAGPFSDVGGIPTLSKVTLSPTGKGAATIHYLTDDPAAVLPRPQIAVGATGTLGFGVNRALNGFGLQYNLPVQELFTTHTGISQINVAGGNEYGFTTGDLALPRNVAIGGSAGGSLQVDGVVSGGFSLTKNGGSTLTLANPANTFTGGLILNSGTVRAGGANSLGPAGNQLKINGGILDIGANNVTAGAVVMSGGEITGTTGSITPTGKLLRDLSGGNLGATISSKLVANDGVQVIGGSLTVSNSNIDNANVIGAAGFQVQQGGGLIGVHTLGGSKPFGNTTDIRLNRGNLVLTGLSERGEVVGLLGQFFNVPGENTQAAFAQGTFAAFDSHFLSLAPAVQGVLSKDPILYNDGNGGGHGGALFASEGFGTSDQFSSRFTGFLTTTQTAGTYSFFTRSDDGSVLFITDLTTGVSTQVVANNFDQGMTERGGAITLAANTKYGIDVGMYEKGGGSGVEVRWDGPDTAKIPLANFVGSRQILSHIGDLITLGNKVIIGAPVAGDTAANLNTITVAGAEAAQIGQIEFTGANPTLATFGSPLTVSQGANIVGGSGALTLNVSRLTMPGLTGSNLPIVKNGPGVLTFTSASTRTASVTINEGTVQTNHVDGLGTGNVAVNIKPFASLVVNAAHARLANVDVPADANLLITAQQNTGNGASTPVAPVRGRVVFQSASGLGNSSTYNLNVEAGGEVFFDQLGADGQFFDAGINMSGTGQVVVGHSGGTLNNGGTFSGAAGLTMQSPGGNIQFNGPLTFTGDLSAEGGELKLRGSGSGAFAANRGVLNGTTYQGANPTAKITVFQGGALWTDNGGYNHKNRINDALAVDVRGGEVAVWGSRRVTSGADANTGSQAGIAEETFGRIRSLGDARLNVKGGTGADDDPTITRMRVNTLERHIGGSVYFGAEGNLNNTGGNRRHRIEVGTFEDQGYNQFGQLVTTARIADASLDDVMLGGAYVFSNGNQNNAEDFATVRVVNTHDAGGVRQIARFNGPFRNQNEVNFWPNSHVKYTLTAEADPTVSFDATIKSFNWDNDKSGGQLRLGGRLTIESGGMIFHQNSAQDPLITDTSGPSAALGELTSGTNELFMHVSRNSRVQARIVDNFNNPNNFGSVALVKSGGSQVIIEQPMNSYSGGTWANRGLIIADPVFSISDLRTGAVLGSGTIYMNGGNLSIRSNSGEAYPTIEVRGSGSLEVRNSNANNDNTISFTALNVTQNNRTLTVNSGNNYRAQFNSLNMPSGKFTMAVNGIANVNGALSGGTSASRFIKTGGGTLTLRGSGTGYQGSVLINGGRLEIANAAALPGSANTPTSGRVIVNREGVLDINVPGGADYDLSLVSFNPGSGLRLSIPQGSGAKMPTTSLALFEINTPIFGSTYQGGPQTPNGMKIDFGGTVRTLVGGRYDSKLALAGPTTFDITTGSFEFGQPIGLSADLGASVRLDKAGGGTLLLNQENFYGAGTRVEAGTINVNHEKGLGGGAVFVGGGTLNMIASAARRYQVTMGGGRALFNVDGEVEPPKVTINPRSISTVASGNRVAPGAPSSAGGSVTISRVDLGDGATLDLQANNGVPLSVQNIQFQGATGTIQNNDDDSLLGVGNINAGTGTVAFRGTASTQVTGNVNAGVIRIEGPVQFGPGSNGTSNVLGTDIVDYKAALTASNGTTDFGQRRLVGEAPGVLPGLIEGRVAGSFNETAPNPGQFGVNPLGPLAGNQFGDAPAEGNGIVPGTNVNFPGWPDNTTYVYTGQVNVPASGNIAFAEQFDDSVLIRIDGVQRLRNTNWDAATTTGKLTLTPGWHEIELRFGQGGGGAGPSGQQGWPGGDATFNTGTGQWQGGKGIVVDRDGTVVGNTDHNNYVIALNGPDARGTDPDLLFRTTGGVPITINAGATFKAGGVHNVLEMNMFGTATQASTLVTADFDTQQPLNEAARTNIGGLANISIGANNIQTTHVLRVNDGAALTISGKGVFQVATSPTPEIGGFLGEAKIISGPSSTITVQDGGNFRVNVNGTGQGLVVATGTGSVSGTGGTIGRLNATAGGSIAPGNDLPGTPHAGTLTVNTLTLDGGAFSFNLGTSASDLLVVTGANQATGPDGFNIAGNNVFTFNTVPGLEGMKFTLIDYNGTNLTPAEVASFTAAANPAYSFNFSNNSTSQALEVTLAPIVTGDNTWIGTTPSITLGTNWTVGTPNAPDAVAVFDDTGINKTVSVDGDVTAGTITFAGPQSYTLQPGATTSGIVRLNGADAKLNVNAGNHVIGVPVSVESNATVSIAAASKLTVNDTINATGKSLTKTGGGTLEAKSLRAATLSVSEGVVKVLPKGAGTASVSRVDALPTVAAGAAIDLADNNMVIGGSTPDAVRQLIAAGAGPARTWDGSGLRTSLGTVNSFTLGYASLLELGGVAPTGFAGETLVGSDVLVKFTRYGDANIDGSVDTADFNRFLGGFGAAGTWARGDFNGDGSVDTADFNLFLGNFGSSASAAEVASVQAAFSAVPEPGTLGLLAVGAMGLLGRRKRLI